MGGIIYIENDDMSVRQWYHEKLGHTGYYLVSDSDIKEHYRKYYRKLRPHWYLYTQANDIRIEGGL